MCSVSSSFLFSLFSVFLAFWVLALGVEPWAFYSSSFLFSLFLAFRRFGFWRWALGVGRWALGVGCWMLDAGR
jgi:hypothetical protein